MFNITNLKIDGKDWKKPVPRTPDQKSAAEKVRKERLASAAEIRAKEDENFSMSLSLSKKFSEDDLPPVACF